MFKRCCNFLINRSKADLVLWVFLLLIIHVCLWHTFLSVPCRFFGHLMTKGLLLGSLVCDHLLRVCTFPIWNPGPVKVLDCIGS